MEREIDSTSEEGFIGSLQYPDIKKKYILERNKKVRDAKANFKREKKFLEDKIKNFIAEDNRHSIVINSCITPSLMGRYLKRTINSFEQHHY